MANVTHIYGNEVTDAAARGSLAPEYSASSTYAVGDLVLHEGQLYECSTAISTAEAWTAAHWTAKTVADEVSSLKGDLSNIQTATSGDIGKALSPKTVSSGTVTEWQYVTAGGGGGGTSDYTDLTNKPSINSVTLSGNKTAADLGLGTYSKPSGGIPASDLASGVIPTVPSASSATPQALGTAAAGSSSDYSRADHVHAMPTAANVGAIALPSNPSTNDFLVFNGSAWVAQSLSTWQGGSY